MTLLSTRSAHLTTGSTRTFVIRRAYRKGHRRKKNVTFGAASSHYIFYAGRLSTCASNRASSPVDNSLSRSRSFHSLLIQELSQYLSLSRSSRPFSLSLSRPRSFFFLTSSTCSCSALAKAQFHQLPCRSSARHAASPASRT